MRRGKEGLSWECLGHWLLYLVELIFFEGCWDGGHLGIVCVVTCGEQYRQFFLLHIVL